MVARRTMTALGLMAAGGLMVAGAVAQVAPPQRDNGGQGRQAPGYVDNADYDPQPYYVDGVEFKPYVPEKPRPAERPEARPQLPAQQPNYVTPAAGQASQPGQLKPYVPTPAQVAASSSASRASGASSASEANATSSASGTTASRPASAPASTTKRPRYAVAVIEALDKVTAESVRFEAPVGKPIRYKGLIYTVRSCETTAADEPMSDVMAYIQVRTSPTTGTNSVMAQKPREVFKGWTFASSPSLNPIQHPVYDAWVVACRQPLAG